MRPGNLILLFLLISILGLSQNFVQWVPGTPCQNCPGSPKFNPGQVNNGNSTLVTTYTETACGLNFVQATVPLFKRNFAALGSTVSANQPANFVISGIPPSANVIKAFIYSDASGSNNVVPSVSVTNLTASVSLGFTMANIGSCSDKCWGYGGSQSYRADVTPIISGNGTYVLSGFPVMPQSPSYDTDGATLFVIYSDPTAPFTGNIVIADGCMGISGTVNSNIYGFNVCSPSYSCVGFGLVGDLQRITNTPFRFNSTTNNFTKTQSTDQVWDFVTGPAPTPTVGQTSANFGLTTTGDCYNFVMAGMYYQNQCLTCCGSTTLPPLSVSGSSAVICLGSSATLIPYPAGTYTWYPGNVVSTSLVVTPTISTYYSASMMNSTGCGGTVLPVVVQPPPNISLTAGPSSVCPGLTSIINMSGANSYTLNPGNLVGASTVAVNPTVTSIYTVSGTSNIGCNGSNTLSVGVYTLAAITPTYTSPLCAGGSLSLNIPAAFSYTWTGPPSFTTYFQNPMIPNASTVNSGVYTVSVLGANNCIITTTLNVVCNPQLPITPTVTPFPPICNTTPPFNLTVTPAGGGWSGNPAVNNIGLLSPSFAINGTTTAVYTVMVGPCKNSTTINIDASTFNSAALTSSIPNLCVTNSPFNLMNIVQNTVTGVWQGSGVVGTYSFNPALLTTGIYPLTYTTSSTPNLTACPATSSINVSVTNTVTPAIPAVAPFCNTAPNFTLTASPSGGTWFGSGAVSQGGVVNTSLAPLSNTLINYSVAIGPCINSNTTVIFPNTYNTAALTNSFVKLCYNSNSYNLNTLVQSTVNGVFTGLNVSGHAFSPTGLSTNTYYIVYNTSSSPNPTVCPESQTISIHVLNPPIPNISIAGPFCSVDGTFQMLVSPATGTWIASSYLTAGGAFIPSLSAIGNNAIQYVIGTNTCSQQQTKLISVEAFVPSNIVGSIPDQCNTNLPLNLMPFTQNNLGVWTGPGISGSYFNAAATGAGSFTVVYNTASMPSGLCPSQSTVAVKVFSLAIPVINAVGPFCDKSLGMKIQVFPSGGVFSGINNDAVSPSGFFTPAYGIIGNNIISYSVTQGPCVAFQQSTISVEKFVSAEFVKENLRYCSNDAPINLYSISRNGGGNWTINSSTTGSMFNPGAVNIGYNVITYNTFSSPTQTLCPDTKTTSIWVDKTPEISITSAAGGSCVPAEVLFTSNGSGGSGEWVLGDGTDKLPGLSLVHTYTSAGSYSVVFNYSLGSCHTQTQLTLPVLVSEQPKADFIFEPSEITISAPEVEFRNLSEILGNNRYQWIIEGIGTRTEVNPSVVFPGAGTYNVTLKATSYSGCKASISKKIIVKNDFSIYYPGTFSPNFDGLNDVFMPMVTPFGFDLNSFEMEIFDRWGHSLYYTRDITKGWDGTFQNKGDQVLKEGIYTFKTKIKDLEGNIHSKVGTVVLLH